MFRVNEAGMVQHPRVRAARYRSIERGVMDVVHGIVVHQTGAATASSTLNHYDGRVAGAHFLIDKDGTIYQTASLYQRTNHVGRLRARCFAEHRCPAAELKALKKFDPRAENIREQAKSVPDRYPANRDSIGIELVGEYFTNPEYGKVPRVEQHLYVTVTDAQNASLKWLIDQLRLALEVPLSEVFRHPTVSRKNSTEAATASW